MMKQMLIAIVSLSMVASSAQKIDRLRSGFQQPPESARPWVYWVWMDGNLSREGISADLEAMKRAGIGGVIIMEVNVGIPQGPVKFMSQEWQEHFKHVISEAERLSIEVALISGPGWTGSGGPWVKPEQSMQHIVSSTTQVSGPKHFVGALPRPARRPAFFGDGHLPPEREKAKDDFYENVAVLAFPTPKEREVTKDIDEKALYVRAPYSSQPNVRPFIPSPADYPSPHAGALISTSQIVDLSQSLTPDGGITWDVPSGDWTILRFGRTSTGANTRPAPVPGLGIECDKLDTTALNAHFDAFIGTLLRDIGPRRADTGAGLTMLHIDSWEMGAQNWTTAFRQEFRRRRGYDLLKYLPAVTGSIVEGPEISERFLWDLRQTVNELILQNHAEHLKQLGRRHNLRLSIEPYDMTPCADMSLGAIADVPMCEFWLYGFNTSYSVIEATSIAHTGGREVVAAEAFTSTDTEHWQAYPGSMKALGDWAFCAGVNRFVFHRYQHQPWPDLKPGMTMGPFGVHWERTQTWWEMASAYHAYLSRCQFVLRQGLPVADVCFLVAEGAPHVFRPPSSATRGDPPDRLGYSFDGCSPEVLLARSSVKEGKLVFPDGMKYRMLVLPNRETMTPRLLQKVKELVVAGATVVGPRPRKSPSLADFPNCDAEVERLADEVWGECDGNRITEHRFGKGRVVWEQRPGADSARNGTGTMEPEQYGSFTLATDILSRMGVPPDFESEPIVRYTHRTERGAEIYFVANPENRLLTTQCTFRVSGRQPELWDPVQGKIRYMPQFAVKNGRTSMGLRFEAHQTFFVIFRKAIQKRTGKGRNFAEVEPVAELNGAWDVSFDPRWGGPDTISFSRLEDWSRRPEDGIKYYSGIATYRCIFGVPSTLLTPSRDLSKSRIWLDLGEVKNLGRIRLNGHDLGILWCAPWRVDISETVKPGGNQLEIQVANLWPNRLIGDELLPPDSEFGRRGNLTRWPAWILGKEPRPSTGRYAFATWKHFSGDSPLLPSGLLGPVRLVRSWE